MIEKNPRCAWCGEVLPSKKSVIITTEWTFGGSSRIGWCDGCGKKDSLIKEMKTIKADSMKWEEVFFRVFMRGANRVMVRRTKEWEAKSRTAESSRSAIV